MRQLWKKIEGAFDNTNNGFSGRKLSAFWVIGLVTITHFAWLQSAIRSDNFGPLLEVLLCDFSFAGTCLGLTTYQAIKKDKNAAAADPSANPPTP